MNKEDICKQLLDLLSGEFRQVRNLTRTIALDPNTPVADRAAWTAAAKQLFEAEFKINIALSSLEE